LIIKSGNISVTAAGDGIAAQANLTISDGSFTIITGYFTIATGDDAIHADASITINGGYIAVNCTTGDGLDSNGNLYNKRWNAQENIYSFSKNYQRHNMMKALY
jgi:hypothetical protein